MKNFSHQNSSNEKIEKIVDRENRENEKEFASYRTFARPEPVPAILGIKLANISPREIEKTFGNK